LFNDLKGALRSTELSVNLLHSAPECDSVLTPQDQILNLTVGVSFCAT
jgi:hypothetical protein